MADAGVTVPKPAPTSEFDITVSEVSEEVRLLAAIAFGEASTEDHPDEIAGIAHAAANRAKAWGGKSIQGLLNADPNYTYAANGTNVRFNQLKGASVKDINASRGMRIAINASRTALKGGGTDPSNGAFWWDGVDIKTNYEHHPKVKDGIRFGNPSHNLFGIKESAKTRIIYWQVKDKRTGKLVDSKERGRYEAVWVSTAAQGKTLFWKHDPAYLKATGGKEYK